MPRKDGTLSAVELRRLIKQHNKLMSIQIPKGTNRDGLIKLINDNGYKINHSAQKLEPTVKMKRKPVVNLPPAPVKKTSEEKKQAKDKRDKKRREIESEGIKKALALQKILKKKTTNNIKSMEENKKDQPVTPKQIKKGEKGYFEEGKIKYKNEYIKPDEFIKMIEDKGVKLKASQKNFIEKFKSCNYYCSRKYY